MNPRRNSLAAAILLAIACAQPILAQLPDTPTGRRGNAILAVLQGGAEEVTAAFFTDNFAAAYLAEETADERREALAATLDRLGELQIQGVQKSAGFGATILASSAASGSQIEISYTLEDEEPHRIVRFDIAQAGEAIEPMTLDEFPAAAQHYLAELTAADAFSGTVLVARGDTVVFEAAYGLANRRYDAPNRLDTALNLGSINKIFTRTALAQLAQAGRLSFDDTIADHLPDYPNPDVARRVTVQQLATHTSGLGDIFTDEFAAAEKSAYRKPEDYFPLFADDPLLFEPGQGQRYSNGGYMVLGAIVAAVSGQPYDDYVREQIFAPAGMTHTAPYALDDPSAPIATGYTRGDDDHHAASTPGATGHPHADAPAAGNAAPEPDWRENFSIIPATGTPAGGGYSTVHDLLLFRHALVHHKLLDARHTAWLVSDELPSEAPADSGSYGLGFGGGAPGVNAALEIDGEWTIVVLGNLDPPAASSAAAHLRVMIGAIEDQ